MVADPISPARNITRAARDENPGANREAAEKREDLDRVIIFFDDSAKAIWFRTMKGIDAILIWDCIAREFLSAEAKENDPTGSANQWLIATEIPRIYKKHGADFTFRAEPTQMEITQLQNSMDRRLSLRGAFAERSMLEAATVSSLLTKR